MKIKLKNSNEVALVDSYLSERINRYDWLLKRVPYSDNVYVVRYENLKVIFMHRHIMRAKKGVEIDHINGNGLDNRMDNLRVCSRSENNRNRRAYRNNLSGCKGVSITKNNTNPYRVRITVHKKLYNLGSYNNIIDAAKAYNEGALKYHGEFAKLNIIPKLKKENKGE